MTSPTVNPRDDASVPYCIRCLAYHVPVKPMHMLGTARRVESNGTAHPVGLCKQ